MALQNLANRSIILIITRLLSYTLMLGSPIILVRMWNLESYGQYREFLLYAMLFSSFIGFSINRSLLYFIPHDPHNEKKYVTNVVFFSLLSWIVGTILILTFQYLIKENSSYDFITTLVIFIFFYVNFDFLESYYLAKKKTTAVFIYTTVRTFVRLTLVVAGAFFYNDTKPVILLLIATEGMKAIYTLAYCWRHKLLTFEIDRKKAISQIKYIFPLGFAGVIFYFNKDLGKLLINAQLGPEALAIFVIGCYQIPFVGIVRGAISDTIFPDMATAIRTNPIKGLAIWQKTNVIYCYLTFPMFTICLFFSNEIVGLLFTEKYLAAASIFQISLLFLIRNCFEFASPLRALNYTKPLLYANFLSALINIPLAFILLKLYGLIGPAIAFFFADTLIAIYSCFFVIKKFQITLSTVLYWRKDFSLIMISFLCLPILYISQICTSQLPNIILVVLSIMLYLLSYIFLCQRARIEESQQLNNLITTKLTSNIKISL